MTKSYHPRHKNANHFFVLNGISFEVQEGEFVSIVGKSGAGKTTILKLIIAEEKPDQGRIYLNGQEITRLSPSRISDIRRKIGVVFQDYKLLNSKTVFGNLAFVLGILGKENPDEISKVLKIVGLEEKRHFYPEELSAGEKQKLAIARALIIKPRIILADEPTGNLDPYNTLDIIDLLLKINKMGQTIILATHAKEVVNKIKKRVLILDNGEIISDEERGKFIL